MKRVFYIFLFYILTSCHSFVDLANNIRGVYIGSSKWPLDPEIQICFNSDGTFQYKELFDLYTGSGEGKWKVVGKRIIMEFNDEDLLSDIEKALSAYRQIKGNKSAEIVNRKKIKINNVILKKKLENTSYYKSTKKNIYGV